MSWIADRLNERSSQVAIGLALTSTAGVAAIPSSWADNGSAAWLALIPVWVQAIVHIFLPDAIQPQNGATPNA